MQTSAFLIVLCSPSSAAWRWVNQEIGDFKRGGQAERMIAVQVVKATLQQLFDKAAVRTQFQLVRAVLNGVLSTVGVGYRGRNVSQSMVNPPVSRLNPLRLQKIPIVFQGDAYELSASADLGLGEQLLNRVLY